MAVAADPGGAVFGVWQARSHTGIGVANEPGSLTWNENMSRNFDGNKAFYQAVFGYTFGDLSSEGFRYATLDLDGRPVGGIGELGPDFPAEAQPNWAAYFAVADSDAAAARADELGGIVVRPAVGHPVRADGRAQRRPGRDVLGGQRRGSQRRLTPAGQPRDPAGQGAVTRT